MKLKSNNEADSMNKKSSLRLKNTPDLFAAPRRVDDFSPSPLSGFVLSTYTTSGDNPRRVCESSFLKTKSGQKSFSHVPNLQETEFHKSLFAFTF